MKINKVRNIQVISIHPKHLSKKFAFPKPEQHPKLIKQKKERILVIWLSEFKRILTSTKRMLKEAVRMLIYLNEFGFESSRKPQTSRTMPETLR